ncbi:fimbrial protein [Parabacteroides distasonis]|uniref:fimbrial protein n=1 Tax=Parabacteroides distasonis TaxID=823 RepID=UPI00189988E7|nr:fimbrial protein [Parabacteroides distasonis]MDB8996754.1 fimbrial protein [Parabacteroides distasonis]MDB9070283.1 fimbrial protein [Parabacteroides distasonis]
MKLRNLLFGTMIACAFAACSNEDDPIVGPDQPQTGEVETTLAFAIKGADTKTKAGTQTGAEEKVNNLRVILYTADGNYVASSTTGATKDNVNDNREVQMTAKLPAGVTSYKVLAVANLSTSFADNVGTSLAAMEQGAPFGTGAAIGDAGLPMSSGVSAAFTVTLGKANYYGYTEEGIVGYDATKDVIVASEPLPLIRNVARVDLKKVTLDLNASTKEPGYTAISAQLQLQEAFILHARIKAAAADLSTTPSWWNSTAGTWGTIAAQYVASTTELLSGRNVFDESENTFKNVVGTANAGYKTALSQTITQNTTTAASQDLLGISFYILENDQTTASREVIANAPDVVTNHSHQYATELVIKGKYKVTSATNTSGTYKYPEEVRYWPIKIGIDGISGSGVGTGSVHRNYIYEITDATIAGPGYEDPTKKEDDPIQLFVKTKVTDWGKATQTPTIE